MIAEYFIEDGLFFLVTYLPLLYFFSDPVLLLGASHLTSFLCAVALYSKKNESVAFYQSLFAFFCVSFTFLTNAATLFRGACQFVSEVVCCEIFEFVSVPCTKNPVLGVLLVPLAMFNIFRCLSRAYALYNFSEHKKAPGMGTLLVLKITTLLMFIARGKTETEYEKITLITTTYGALLLFVMMMDEKDPFNKRDGRFAWVFALDSLHMCHQAYAVGAEKTSLLIFYLSVGSFVISTLLLIATVGEKEKRHKLGDSFSFFYTALSVATLLYCGAVLNPLLSPWMAFAFFAYACSVAAKHHFCFFRDKKTNRHALEVAVVFLIVDAAALMGCVVVLFAGLGNARIRKENILEASLFGGVAAAALATSITQVVRKVK